MKSANVPSLSVLIPVYRWDISRLVEELKSQAAKLPSQWEIIILDDASGEPWQKKYQKLADKEHIFCHTMAENTGRAAARNRLASLARFEALLFMDCDAEIIDPDYILKMAGSFDGKSVVTGRTLYSEMKPEDPLKRLRWKYGKKRESVSASVRKKKPWRSFTTFHFLASADIFSRIAFRTNHPGYGHEDTLFGLDLARNGIPVMHTDIPLQHNGLENAQEFLQKTAEAVHTLASLLREEGCRAEFVSEVRLVKKYCTMLPVLKTRVVRTLLVYLYPVMKNRLAGGATSLFLLDMYKLGLLLDYMSPRFEK